MTLDTLGQKDQQLQLMLALDVARDAVHDRDDPEAMFHATAKIMKEQFNADSCAILLIDETGKETDMIVSLGIAEEQALKLCWEAVKLTSPDALPDVAWTHTLGVLIILEKQPLGSIVLTREARPFDESEKNLLFIAENQLDSAVIQARMMWKLAQRNRELEAIYQIDRMSDSNAGESDLISGFTSILVEYFRAELCMVIVTHIDTGELIVRGVVGKHSIPVGALDNIRNFVGNIHMPQVIPTPSGIDEMILLAAPFIVAGLRLGAVVVGRKRTFTVADQRLIYAMMTQMDSAIVHSRVTQQLARRNQELEVIYRIDHIRDEETDFEPMLQRVLTEICRVVASELGYLMLYDDSDEHEPLELKAATVDGLLTSPAYYEIINRFSRQALEAGEMVHSNRPDGPIRSIIAVPLILNEKIIGVFGTVNSTNPRGFNAEDRRMLRAITSQVDTAVFERLERRRMRKVLSRSVDPKVLNHLLERADDAVLSGEKVMLTVLFADLRGSTEWAERVQPEQLVQTLNIFLGRMTDVIFKHGGTLDKFVGDEVIALFGVPIKMEDHAYHAMLAALEMRAVHAEIVAELSEKALELPPLGIGISTGEMIAGEIGSTVRSDFTAMGRAMNLGSRLCSAAKGGEICISATTYDLSKHLIEATPAESVALKGLGDVPFYHLRGLKGTASENTQIDPLQANNAQAGTSSVC
jgi:adenylate cyclase